eukprot:IDg13122t1
MIELELLADGSQRTALVQTCVTLPHPVSGRHFLLITQHANHDLKRYAQHHKPRESRSIPGVPPSITRLKSSSAESAVLGICVSALLATLPVHAPQFATEPSPAADSAQPGGTTRSRAAQRAKR